MATILLNGVLTDTETLTGSDLADKLTISGGVESLDVDLAEGDDAVEIYADSEDVTGAEIRVSEGDDDIQVLASSGVDPDGDADDFVGLPVSLGDSLLGGPGDDVIFIDDGLVQLEGAVKGNEGDDFLDVSNINGGTVNGNSGDDIIDIGDTGGLANDPGERGEAALSSGSVMGGQGDDIISVDAEVNDSAIRGNEGDDTITITGEFSGTNTINGNAGDDVINAATAEGAITVIGGQGDDTLSVGNGQTVTGGLGADTFVVAASGGVTISDFDQIDTADCFCEDEIQVQNIVFDTYSYNVNTDLYTSASSWTGDIKVKAVAEAANTGDTAVARLTRTKTETISALAVARLVISETTTATIKAAAAGLDAPTYPVVGFTAKAATFVNGNATAGPGTTIAFGANDLRAGIGAAFGSAEGVWYDRTPAGVGRSNVTGVGPVFTVRTYTEFAKGDFSFLGLTAKATIGVASGQKLVYSDITNATIKNHWASYTKSKNTTDVGLYNLALGTANFSTITTGKAYMVLTNLEDKAYKTTTIEDATGVAVATASLNLDNTFQAWRKVTSDAGLTVFGSDKTVTQKTLGGSTEFFEKITLGFYTSGGALDAAAGNAIANGGGAFRSEDGAVTFKSAGAFTNTRTTANGAVIGRTGGAGAGANNFTLVPAASFDRLIWDTFSSRALHRLSVTTGYTGSIGGQPFANQTVNVGVDNINVTETDTRTATNSLAIKIKASTTAKATASVALSGVIKRTTIEGTTLDITTCPAFPTTGTLNGRIFDGNGVPVSGEVVGSFNQEYVWGTTGISIGLNGAGTAPRITTGSGLTALANAAAGDGFFSGSDFNVANLVADNFGQRAVAQATSDAQNVPFRVLFFDTDATDNGLYVISGMANYDGGVLTGLNTAPTGTSSIGGKHTIVKVTGDKGHPIELSDINFV